MIAGVLIFLAWGIFGIVLGCKDRVFFFYNKWDAIFTSIFLPVVYFAGALLALRVDGSIASAESFKIMYGVWFLWCLFLLIISIPKNGILRGIFVLCGRLLMNFLGVITIWSMVFSGVQPRGSREGARVNQLAYWAMIGAMGYGVLKLFKNLINNERLEDKEFEDAVKVR